MGGKGWEGRRGGRGGEWITSVKSKRIIDPEWVKAPSLGPREVQVEVQAEVEACGKSNKTRRRRRTETLVDSGPRGGGKLSEALSP
jgi:hypothetical protein